MYVYIQIESDRYAYIRMYLCVCVYVRLRICTSLADIHTSVAASYALCPHRSALQPEKLREGQYLRPRAPKPQSRKSPWAPVTPQKTVSEPNCLWGIQEPLTKSNPNKQQKGKTHLNVLKRSKTTPTMRLETDLIASKHPPPPKKKKKK